MTKKLGISVLILLVSFLSIGAAQAADDKAAEEVAKKVAVTLAKISVQDLKPLVDGKKILIIDVRDKNEYDRGHISGASNLPRAMNMSGRLLEYYIEKIVPHKDTQVVVYCEFTLRSPLTVKAMNEIGYKNAMFLEAGLTAWKKAGYPLVTN